MPSSLRINNDLATGRRHLRGQGVFGLFRQSFSLSLIVNVNDWGEGGFS
jgi:hypothetical protein